MVATSSKVKDAPHDMDVPGEIEIRTSHVDAERMGLWCKKIIKKGSRFGPFIGDKALQVDDRMDPSFIWEIVDVETKEFLFYINATDPKRGNWMRYINCARYFEEQNIVSEQDGIDIFFEAIKDIEPGRELLTWYEKSPIRRKKGKKRTINHVRRAKKTVSRIISELSGSISNTASSVSQRGRRRSAKKYWKIEENADPRDAAKAAGELSDLSVSANNVKDTTSDLSVNTEEDVSCGKLGSNGFFEFELMPVHTSKNRLGRKMFQCDVCSGVYRHGFSLKRHYLRNHINRHYISRVDALNCNIALEEDDDKKKLTVVGTESSVAINSDKQDDASNGGNESSHGVRNTVGQNGHEHSTSQDVVTTLQLDVEEIASELDGPPKTIRGRPTTLPGLYRCYICDKLFDKVGSLKAHFVESHATGADKRFACRHCQMQFKHRQNLVRHEVVHTGAKPYVCDHCNKRFPTLTNRRRHERIHRGTRLACPLCSSSFTQTNDLKKHVRRQHPESYRACAYCSRYFTADSQLSVHLRRVHPGADLDANRRQASIQRDARSAALEADRAESKRLADVAAAGTAGTASSSTVGQFACTVCNKSFADYANMCRHRRLAHGCGILGVDQDESGSDEEGVNVLAKVARAADHTSVVAAMDLQQAYFAGVSKNIAANLSCHLEGKSEHMARASSHIRWKHGSSSASSANAVTVTAALSADNGSSSVRLEDFNFPRGFKIRPLSELYDTVEEPCGDAVRPKDQHLIQVPDVRICHTCKSVFHSTAELDEHVKQHRDANYKATPDADPGLSVLVPEQPLDLRSPVTPTSGPCDQTAKHVVLTIEEDKCETASPTPPASVEKLSPAATEVGKKILCLVCFSEFQDVEDLHLHQSERHANIDCRHIEVDVNYFPSSTITQPSVVGLLNVRSSQLPNTLDYRSSDVTSTDDVTCTKCHRSFPSRSTLHAHIVECGDYWRNLSDRLTWVFVLRGSQIPAPPPASVSSTTSSPRNKQQQKRRGKYRWGTISTSGDAISRRLQKMLLRQHVGIPMSGEETGAPAMSRAATGGGGGGSRRASARISSRRSSDSPPPVSSETLPAVTRNVVDSRRRPTVVAAVHGQNTRRHNHRRVAAETEEAPKTMTAETFKCDRCSTSFQTTQELSTHTAAVCYSDGVLDDSTGAGHDAENGVNDDEDVFDPTKHLCIYCNRQFTFIRALRRHVTESCLVRRDLVEKNEYIDDEWETQLTASAGIGQSSGGKLAIGSADGANEESIGVGADGGRGGKRRRKCMNWTSSKSRSRRSARSSDDAEDSLFGWEDAFLSTWGKDEREDITRRDHSLTSGSALTSSAFADMKASSEKTSSNESAVPTVQEQSLQQLQQSTDVKVEMDAKLDVVEKETQVESSGFVQSEECDEHLSEASASPNRVKSARTDFNNLSSDLTSTPSVDQQQAVMNDHSASASTDPDTSADAASIANSSATSAGAEDGQDNSGNNDTDGVEEPGQKKSRKRRGHRLTMVKRKKS